MEFVHVEPPGADIAVIRTTPRGPFARRGALLFIHGLGDSASAWSPVADAGVLDPFEIVLVDLLGHGSSDKPDDFDYRPASHAAVLFMALRKIAIEGPLHIVGYSLGGAVAVELSRFPRAALASLTLVEPALDPARMAFLRKVTAQNEVDFVRSFSALLESFSRPDLPEADRRWAETAAFTSGKAFYRSSKGLLEAGSRGELIAHFRQVRARLSLILSPETYEAWPGAKDSEGAGTRVFLLESQSKMPMYDNPGALAEAIAKAVE